MNYKTRPYTGVNTRPLYETPGGKIFTSIEELNKEYDIDASVPDIGSVTERFINDSAKAREELDCKLDVSYGPTLAESLDIFPGEKGGPIVIFLHGGYWRILTSKEFNFVARGLVPHGATVIIPTYALCPSVSMDEIVRQHRAVVAWAYHHAEELGADRDRIIVTGQSAGGHGVGMLLATDWENEYGLPSDIIHGACAISGLFDLRPLPYTFIQPYLQLTWDQVLRNSPILHLPKSSAQLLITRGGKQTSEFLRQSDDFYKAWIDAGLQGEFWKQPECNHFDELLPLSDPNSEFVHKIMQLAK